jgi:alpha-L-fucosidase 2
MLRRAVIFLICLLPGTAAARAGLPPVLIPDHGAASTSLATFWTGAFVTGNGTLGAMVMGGGSSGTAEAPHPQEDTLYFSHHRLFLPVGTRAVVPLLADTLDDLRQTIRTRGYGPAMANAFAGAQKQQFPGLMYCDPFVPACEFKIKMSVAGTPRDYLRTENFQTGEVTVRWSDDGGRFLRKLFISRADSVAVLWIGPAPNTGNAELKTPNAISCDLWIPPVPSVPVRTFQQNNPAAAPADGAANALIKSTLDIDSSGMTMHNVYREGRGSGYDVAVRAVADGGMVTAADGKISVHSARSVLVLLRIEPFARAAPDTPAAVRAALDQLAPQYDALLAPHVKRHQELFNRSALDLGAPPADRQLTTDALLARAGHDAKGLGPADASPMLLERLYEAARYELICATGDGPDAVCPPNLQGLWAANWAPSVSLAGDYAFNAPLHLAIASALSCRTPELMQGVFQLAEDSLPDWQLNAQNLFGARGILVPLHQSSSGRNIQWSDRAPGGLCWTAGAALLAHWYYEYYLYTGDRQFLAQRAVPFMKQAALFYEDFLTLDASGKYRFSPSFSTDNAAGDNSTQDILAATELLTNLIAACGELGIENGPNGGVARWSRMLTRMPPCLVAPNGELQEWALKDVMNKPLQRHIPHLYAIYPGRLFDPETTPELWQASRAAWATRLHQWFRKPNLLAEAPANPQPIQDRLQMALCAARFGDGATALEILTRIAAKSTYPSLMTQRYEDDKTFVADGGGAIPEIINSCLVDSQPGRLDLLPALPAAWKTGEIRGLGARSLGGAKLTITRLRWAPDAIDLELVSTRDQPLTLRLPRTSQRPTALIMLQANRPGTFHFPLNAR